MTLLFQNPSIGLVLLALPQVLCARKVVFYRPYWLAKEWVNPRRRHRMERIIRWINPRASVIEQDPEEAFPLAYENNLASDRAMEEFFPRVSGSASFAALSALIADPHLDRFYKMRLLPWLLYQTQFYRTARHRIDSGEELRLIPDSHDPHALHRPFFSEEGLRPAVPRAVRAWLRIKDRSGRVLSALLGVNLILLVGASVLFVLKTALRAGIRRRAAPVRADVVAPLIWGFNADGIHRGVKIGVDNSHLLDGELDSSRVAFYFSDWRFTPKERRIQEERMARRGILHFDPERFPLTPKLLQETAGHCARLLKSLPRRPGLFTEDHRTARVSASLFYNFLKCRLFDTWAEYKVFVERQDYSAAHVVRTILAEKLGRLTVGDHHSAPDGPTGFPVIRYTHIHRHGVWGEAFLRSYGAHWDHMENILIGSWRIDFIKAAQQEGVLRGLEERFQHLYGGRRPLVVLLLPTLEENNLLPLIQEEIAGLRLLRGLIGDFTAVCRFRSVELAGRYRALGLEEVMREDPRVVMDLSGFTTYEWFALADAVIVSGISTGMVEAAAAGKPVFAFDHQMLAERIFSPYGKDLVLNRRRDLVRVFKGISSGFRRFDCQWERLARDFTRYSDGGCIRRYRQMILDAVRDAGASNRASDPPAGPRVLEQVAG